MRKDKMRQLSTLFNSEIDNLRRDFLTPFDALFDQFFNESFPTFRKDFGTNFFQQGSYPKCNVINCSDKIIIEAAVPGLDKDDVDIEILEGTLMIVGNKKQQTNNEQPNYVHRELKRSAFKRTFKLSEHLEQDQVSAEFKNGILTIEVPKKEPAKVEEKQPTKIKIK